MTADDSSNQGPERAAPAATPAPGSNGTSLGVKEAPDSNGIKYRLGRGYISSTRLNLQHHLWRDTLGFLLHPAIVDSLRTTRENRTGDITIADLATGTGIFLVDALRSPELKRSLGELQLYGFDISPDQYPHRRWLPPNLRLEVSDMLREPEEQYWGKFDVVHIRLIVTVVKNNDPGAVIEHVKKLLKPGGWIQWDEPDMKGGFEVLKGDSDGDTTHMESYAERVRNAVDDRWVRDLPEILEAHGFEAASRAQYPSPPELYHVWTHNQLTVAEEISWQLPDRELGERVREDLCGALAESHPAGAGAVFRQSPSVAIGRIPPDGGM